MSAADRLDCNREERWLRDCVQLIASSSRVRRRELGHAGAKACARKFEDLGEQIETIVLVDSANRDFVDEPWNRRGPLLARVVPLLASRYGFDHSTCSFDHGLALTVRDVLGVASILSELLRTSREAHPKERDDGRLTLRTATIADGIEAVAAFRPSIGDRSPLSRDTLRDLLDQHGARLDMRTSNGEDEWTLQLRTEANWGNGGGTDG